MLLSTTHNVVILLCIHVLAHTVFGAHSTWRSSYAIKETHHVPRQWRRVGPATAGSMMNLQIGLKQGRFDELEKHLYEGNSTTSKY